MAFKDFFGKVFNKSNSSDIMPEKSEIVPFASDAFPVVKLSDSQLSVYKSIPLSGLASIGTAFSQMPAGARTIVETVSKNVTTNETLFVGINPKGVPGFLRENAYGTTGNIIQVNSQGKQVIAGRMRFKAVGNLPVTETTTTTLPIDPTLMIVAVALMTIEKKLDGIQKSVEEVLQFLKQEKQSRQRGNLNMLTEIMDDYKINCKNEQFCISRASEVLSIKTAAYQDIDFYQSQIEIELQKQQGIHGAKDAQSILDAVTYQFAEYQLACHIFAFSSFLCVMLQKDFEVALIENETAKMLAMVKRYETLYADCHTQIAKYQRSAIEAKLLDSVGVVAQGVGKAIGAIPIIKDGSLDEALISAGESISQYNQDAVQRKLNHFETLEVNRMNPFIDNLKTVTLLCNTPNAMITDGENLYVLQSV